MSPTVAAHLATISRSSGLRGRGGNVRRTFVTLSIKKGLSLSHAHRFVDAMRSDHFPIGTWQARGAEVSQHAALVRFRGYADLQHRPLFHGEHHVILQIVRGYLERL
jgi:hypothetical protein